MCHQKCLVVDSNICLVGSANMTHYSRDHAYEFGVCCTQNATVQSCEAKITSLWDRGALVTEDEARRRQANRKRSSSQSRPRSTHR